MARRGLANTGVGPQHGRAQGIAPSRVHMDISLINGVFGIFLTAYEVMSFSTDIWFVKPCYAKYKNVIFVLELKTRLGSENLFCIVNQGFVCF